MRRSMHFGVAAIRAAQGAAPPHPTASSWNPPADQDPNPCRAFDNSGDGRLGREESVNPTGARP